MNPHKRWQDHCGCRAKRGIYSLKWIKSLQPDKPIMIELETVFNDWVEAEQFWIAYFKSLGARLTNLTVGGEGAVGYKATEETRRKLSASSIGHTRGLGKTVTEETRKKLSVSSMGNMNGLGRKHTAEARMKNSIAATGKTPWNKGKTSSIETRAKISMSLTGNKHGEGKTPWNKGTTYGDY